MSVPGLFVSVCVHELKLPFAPKPSESDLCVWVHLPAQAVTLRPNANTHIFTSLSLSLPLSLPSASARVLPICIFTDCLPTGI